MQRSISSAQVPQTCAGVREALFVHDAAICWRQVWAASELLRLTLHDQLEPQSFVAEYMQALLLCPEGPTLLRLEPNPVTEVFNCVCIIAGNRQAILGAVCVPPSLANATPRPARAVGGLAVRVGIAISPSCLGTCCDGALVVAITPAELAEGVISSGRANGQGEAAAAAWQRLLDVATEVRAALAVFGAGLALTALRSAVLDPVGVQPAGGVDGAVVVEVRAVIVAGTDLLCIVGLEGLARS
mmetsp:Transcript_79128/g.183601  ORF Transcript_79128/g.183601 Transcript_79128/m.183601 type:complete len:243 (+) Transcript_79128:89-817(+)